MFNSKKSVTCACHYGKLDKDNKSCRGTYREHLQVSFKVSNPHLVIRIRRPLVLDVCPSAASGKIILTFILILIQGKIQLILIHLYENWSCKKILD